MAMRRGMDGNKGAHECVSAVSRSFMSAKQCPRASSNDGTAACAAPLSRGWKLRLTAESVHADVAWR